jgi:putative hydrolase of the HAD superfamily
MPISLVFFDAGNTIIHPYPSVGDLYSSVSARYGIVADPQDVQAAFKTAWKELTAREEAPTTLVDQASEKDFWRKLVAKVMGTFGEIEQYDDYFEELWDLFASKDAWRVDDDTLPVFKALRERDIRLGLISNWDSRLRALLETLDLLHWFDVVTISAEVGVEKPHARIFELALKEADLPGDRCLHVGDLIELDALGARGAGINGIHLDLTQPTDLQADPPRVARLLDLLELVG